MPDPVVEERRERILLAGDLPSPADPPSGCRFHTRCPWRQETRCDDEVPVLRQLGPGHLVSCHWAEEIRDGLLRPRSPEEVAATMGVSVRPTGVANPETDALADVTNDAEIVRDEQEGDAELVLQVHQEIDDLRLDRDVERGNGLVAHDE